MRHTRHRKQTVRIIDVQVGIGLHERMNGLIEMYRIAYADELVRPPNILQDLSLARRTNERSQIRIDHLDESKNAPGCFTDVRDVHPWSQDLSNHLVE